MSHRFEQARWVFPGDGEPPKENPTATANIAIIPALANAHTHLEFSDLAEPVTPAQPFTRWIRNVIAHRRNESRNIASIIESGIEETRSGGVQFVGEIATDWNENGTINQRSEGITFCEVIGFRSETIETTIKRLNSFLKNHGGRKLARIGISPHAPYSVHPELYRQLIEIAHQKPLPVAVHLAETKSEIEFLANQTGEFREMLEEFGIWQDGIVQPGRKPLDYLEQLAKLDRALVIHGNYLDDEEISFLADHPNIVVVYCPRTHEYFGHDPHPWLRMQSAGVSLAIGTDSRASNPDLSVFNELKFLAQRFPKVDKSWLLDLGTIHSQQALGSEGLASTYVKLPDVSHSDPYELLFHPKSKVVE